VRVWLLFGVLLTVALLLLGSMLSGKFGATHRLTLDFIGYMQSGVVHVVDKFTGFKNNYITNWSLQEENKRLLERGDKYLTELQKYREAYLEARTFEALLNFKKGLSIDPLSARVVGKEPSFWYKTIIVDRGRNDDIEEGMTVFVPEGVVGQIIQVGDGYSKVLLANAPTSAIDAIIQKNRTRGILRGAGSRGYVLNYVLKNADVAVGDYVVTAGIGGLFPTGMVVGTVSKIHNRERGMFQEIEVTPEVDFQKLEYVFIDRTNRKKIIDEMNRAPMK
jgi:rod shape-determining protein MreC